MSKEEKPDEGNQDALVNMCMSDSFRAYVKDHYVMAREEQLSDPRILQMIYAIEWFDIPRDQSVDLIQLHPYLTKRDESRLYYVDLQHKMEFYASFLLFSLAASGLMLTRGPRLLRRNSYVRMPVALALGFGASYVLNETVYMPSLRHDLVNMGLAEKYFELDLNAEMMQKDLKEMGIDTEARFFDLEEVQKQVN